MTCSSSINIPSYLLCAQTIVSCGVLGAFLEVCLVPVSGWNPALSINRACMHIPICHLGPYAWTVSCSCAVAYYMHPVIAHWKVSVSNQYALPLLTIRYQILSACPEEIVCPALQHWRLVFWMLAHFWSSIAAACSEFHSTCNITKQIEQPECLANFFVVDSSSEVSGNSYSYSSHTKTSERFSRCKTRFCLETEWVVGYPVLAWKGCKSIFLDWSEQAGLMCNN